MEGYFEARTKRLERNQVALFELADEVLKADPKIEVYHHHADAFIQGLVFIKGEDINSVQFHEVPYRWSGCGHGEFNSSHSGGENVSMPFTKEDVLTTFSPITSKRKSSIELFKSKKHYLDWCSYLVKYKNTKP